MADTNLADQIMMQSQRSMEAMTREAPRPVLSKAAKEEAARHAQADRVLKAPITKGRDVRQFHGFSMRVDHERYSPWPGGQHGGDGGFKLCLNRPTREPRPAPAEPHDDDDDEWAGDNAGPRPWDSHAKLLSAKDQRRRANLGPDRRELQQAGLAAKAGRPEQGRVAAARLQLLAADRPGVGRQVRR